MLYSLFFLDKIFWQDCIYFIEWFATPHMKRIHHRLCDTHTQTEYTDFKDHTRSLTHHHLTMQLVCEAGPGRGNSAIFPNSALLTLFPCHQTPTTTFQEYEGHKLTHGTLEEPKLIKQSWRFRSSGPSKGLQEHVPL